MAVQSTGQISNLLFQLRNCPGLLQNILFIDIAQLDFRHIIGLHLIDTEADHQVGNDLILHLRLPDNGNCLVDIQKDPLQTF